jgi:hypothetical protein
MTPAPDVMFGASPPRSHRLWDGPPTKGLSQAHARFAPVARAGLSQEHAGLGSVACAGLSQENARLAPLACAGLFRAAREVPWRRILTPARLPARPLQSGSLTTCLDRSPSPSARYRVAA